MAYVYAQYAQSGLKDGSLVQVLEDWSPDDPGFLLYYPSRSGVPAPLRAFIALVQAQPARSRHAAA